MNPADLFADVSSYNGSNDWALYKTAGRRVAACKATEGRTVKDPTFPVNWQGMAKAGLEVRVAYGFARPSHNPPETEAREFLRTVYGAGMRSTDLRCLDIEASPRETVALTRTWVQRYCDFVARHAGRGPLIYSGGWWWTPNLGAWWPSRNCLGYWHSAYTSAIANLPPRHGRLLAHQFTDGAAGPQPHSLPGTGQGDVNRIAIGYPALAAIARGTIAYRTRFVALRAAWPVHLRRP